MKRNRYWTEYQDQFLVDNYASMTPTVIAKNIGKSLSNVCDRARSLGLVKDKRVTKAWSQEEHEFLSNNYGFMSLREISFKLDRSLDSVLSRASDHKVTKARPVNTSIELVVKSVLDELGVSYQEQVKVYTGRRNANNQRHFFKADLVIDSTVIEVQGDYWHCNPEVYPNGPQDPVQKKHTERDIDKLSCFTSLGYKVIYVWESECSDRSILKERLKAEL